MSDLIVVTGNLTSPPERRGSASGVAMATFGLASTERRLENGTWKDIHTNFYSVAAYRRLAEHALSSLQKGQRVIVVGRLKVRTWEVNGRSGTSVDIDATSLGPDLLFGTTTFVKDAPSGNVSEAPPAEDASVGVMTSVGVDAWSVPGADASAGAPAASAALDAAARELRRGELVSAAILGDDMTPF
ncbi:MAG: single-stranded DNA-binding protein [Microbacterium sp.]